MEWEPAPCYEDPTHIAPANGHHAIEYAVVKKTGTFGGGNANGRNGSVYQS
jgi:hypothetical protein